MATQLATTAVAPRYEGPIFDADTHLWEMSEAWTRYLPADLAEDWGIKFRRGDDGQFAMYVGKRKVEISADHLREEDRKSTRLNSSHSQISYAVFCLKKKNNKNL